MALNQKDPIIVPLGEGTDMIFRHIPAGRFRMGQRGGDADEEPVNEVEVDEFWMGETPVTQEQYRVMAENCVDKVSLLDGNRGSEPSEYKNRDDSASRPVEMVNWYEARVVALWLMGKIIKDSLIPRGYVVDLPPEDHWEYVCRAGTATHYWSGDGEAALAEVGWYGGYMNGETHPVRKFAANLFGLYDLHGNVQEWCLDLFEAVRGRLRINGELGAAYEDKSILVRQPLLHCHVKSLELFNRICKGELKLSGSDHETMAGLRDRGIKVVKGEDPSWLPIVHGAEIALIDGSWPKSQTHLAEEIRGITQGWVDSALNTSDPNRVLRGGSFEYPSKNCRSSYRDRIGPCLRDKNVGFRIGIFSNPSKIVRKKSIAEVESKLNTRLVDE